ncbi:phosphotransferase family protein [Flindersiella endophytica]
MEELTDMLVAAALSGVLGDRVVGVERLAGYVGNQDFMLHTAASGDFVLKAAGHPGELVAEAWACDRVRELGVPVPEVVALESEPGTLPLPFLLTRRLAGSELGAGPPHPVLTTVGEHLRAVHSITLDGYGFRKQPPYDAWTGFTGEAQGCLGELATANVITGELAARIDGALTAHAGLIAYDKAGVLLHGDLKPPHIFGVWGRLQEGTVARDGQLTGIIDWGDTLAGDPLYDIARFSLVGKTELDLLLEGYGLALTPTIEETLAGYRIVRMTTTLRDEFRNGGDWFDTYRASIIRDLDLLSA